MANETIKQRLDALDGKSDDTNDKLEEANFTESIMAGWKVRKSSTGLKIATFGIDKNVTWSSGNSLSGAMITNESLIEALPTGLFKVEPSVIVETHTASTDLFFMDIQKTVAGLENIGEHKTLCINVKNGSEEEPTKLHYVITAFGF